MNGEQHITFKKEEEGVENHIFCLTWRERFGILFSRTLRITLVPAGQWAEYVQKKTGKDVGP
jgi:hypothetical protein